MTENILNAHLQRKRKLNLTNEETNKQKMSKVEVAPTNPPKTMQETAEAIDSESSPQSVVLISVQTEPQPIQPSDPPMEVQTIDLDADDKETDKKDAADAVESDKPSHMEVDHLQNPQLANVIEENVDSPLRRGSQESTATTTTQTTSTTSTDSTSSSSDSSSSLDSSSDSDDSTSEDDSNKV